MASSFKSFNQNDIISTRTLLHEAIPLTGSLASGTYGTFQAETNIKNYSHGMFSSVYDYPYLSSSANHIFDITIGFSGDSAHSASCVSQRAKKLNIYNQMAQVLAGYDHTGSILKFDTDGNILAGGTKIRECYFINFARLLNKDEIKKGSFTMKLGNAVAFASANNTYITLTDNGAQNDYRVNSPAGEYGILSASAGLGAGATSGLCGLIYYQAGVAVVTASVFRNRALSDGKAVGLSDMDGSSTLTIDEAFLSSSIQLNADYLRHRIYDISYQNTTELNSTIYFCRVNHNDFNYSSNPTYVSGSKMRVKNNTLDQPVSYITQIGLYGPDNSLLAVAKLSEPLKKTPDTELTIRVRTDY